MADAARAELDYAFFAQRAHVNPDGTLSVADASFLRLQAQIGDMVRFAVAGRVRLLGGKESADLAITFGYGGPADAQFSTDLTAFNETYGEDERRHVLFTLETVVNVTHYGDFEAIIALDGEEVRRLVFRFAEGGAGGE